MIVTVFALLWCATFFAQLVDLAAESIELRAAAGPARPGRGRVIAWVAAAAGVTVIAASSGAALAVMRIEAGQLAVGVVIIDLLVFVVGAVAVAAVTGLLRPTSGGYPGVSAQIAQLVSRRVTKSDVASIRHSLALVDAAHASRSRTLAWLRFTPSVIGLAVVVSVVIALTTSHAWRGWWWLSVVDLLMPAASVLIALATDRVAGRARDAWGAVFAEQRAVIETELDLLERRVSRGVTGLSERVSKALGILREHDLGK